MGRPIMTIARIVLYIVVAVIIWHLETIFEKSLNVEMAVTTKIGVALYVAIVITCIIAS